MSRTTFHTCAALGFLAMLVVILAGTVGIAALGTPAATDVLRGGAPQPGQHLFASDVADRAGAPLAPSPVHSPVAARPAPVLGHEAGRALPVSAVVDRTPPNLLTPPLRI
jgi:hypothetical protein